jgi:hypothetical protein
MAIREILPANYQDVLFANEGVYTNTGWLCRAIMTLHLMENW